MTPLKASMSIQEQRYSLSLLPWLALPEATTKQKKKRSDKRKRSGSVQRLDTQAYDVLVKSISSMLVP